MKTKKYVKITLINKTDEDLINNIFPFYLMMICELLFLAVLQEELNFWSVLFLITAAILLFILAYKKGVQDGGYKHE